MPSVSHRHATLSPSHKAPCHDKRARQDPNHPMKSHYGCTVVAVNLAAPGWLKVCLNSRRRGSQCVFWTFSNPGEVERRREKSEFYNLTWDDSGVTEENKAVLQ